MNHVFLSAAIGEIPQVAPQPVAVRRLALESMDGQRRLLLDGSSGWWRMDGDTGLEMPPFDVITASAPGVAGSMLRDVRVQERPVFVPIFTASANGHVSHLQMLDEIRSLVDPLSGTFRLVGMSARDERELVVVYTGGLEGAAGRSESGMYWRKVGLAALACDPFVKARTDRLLEFGMSSSGQPFLGAVGGLDAPWPGSLGSSAVIGLGMQIRVGSEVPVYPTLELVGPMASFAGDMSTGWSVSVPDGVLAGQTLRIVTDPREKSIRLDGNKAAGMVARGSTLKPFYPGDNVLNVVAPGGTEDTRVRLSWREAYRSLW